MTSHVSLYRHAIPMLGMCCALALLAVAMPLPASAAAIDVPVSQPILTDNELLWQVAPDECFNGIGVDYPAINPDGTCSVGQPKANQSYPWGLTEQSGKLWFGTLANGFCLVAANRTSPTPHLTSNAVCEYGMAEQVRDNPGFPAFFGDWRTPRIYTWDLTTHTLTQQTVNAPLLQNTLGLRGAGSIDNIAFLAGPSLLGGSANFFAFQADTGKFLGACARKDYNYVRGWAQVDGVLYVGVSSGSYGSVLRWNGTPSSFKAGNYCSQFIEVGRVDASVANITLYVGADGLDRLAISTVPIQRGNNGAVSAKGGVAMSKAKPGSAGVAGVWISPPIPAGGLTPAQVDQWTEIWTPVGYDPDTITARYGYSGGAVKQYDGWLYWGTIHLQNAPTLSIHENCTYSFCFGMPANNQELLALQNGVYRSTSLWRGRNLEDPATSEIQLVYGESELPACCSAPKTFAMTPTGWTPLYGPSGYGNRGNEYTWTMEVFDGHLFIGTYDASSQQGPSAAAEDGADLWRIDSSDSPAVNENYSGLGDINNNGIRILHALDDGSGLIAGMTNPYNLAPGGGWELRLLKEGSPQVKQDSKTADGERAH